MVLIQLHSKKKINLSHYPNQLMKFTGTGGVRNGVCSQCLPAAYWGPFRNGRWYGPAPPGLVRPTAARWQGISLNSAPFFWISCDLQRVSRNHLNNYNEVWPWLKWPFFFGRILKESWKNLERIPWLAPPTFWPPPRGIFATAQHLCSTFYLPILWFSFHLFPKKMK